MLDLLDLLLLRRGIPADDRTLTFRRIDGAVQSNVIYFLPWHTPYGFARQAGFAPLEFLAAYEMPPAIVSSEPELSVRAMRALVQDAERLLDEHNVAAREALIVGLSVGTYPAIYLANRIGARLCAVAPADRADLMTWQSPAARLVKRRAIQKGYRLSHYARAMAGCHPAQNLGGVAPDSVFVIGRRDPFVPARRRAALLDAIERHLPSSQVVMPDAGHFATLIAGGRHQLAMLGLAPPRWWRMPRPLEWTLPWRGARRRPAELTPR
ncbi:MAG TPA: hypothetical protein VG900_12795 [Hyphomicrobiaceae bacterium]|jgi:hypothetical protein|nr:hypothetical protein [Hyphomicrobiaceae bacterium]